MRTKEHQGQRWIAVVCRECGVDYDVRDVLNETIHTDSLLVVSFDCPKGHHCEASRFWKSHHSLLKGTLPDEPDVWRDILKSGGWGLYETGHGTEIFLLPDSDYFVQLYLLPTDTAHWLFSDTRRTLRPGIARTIAMGNSAAALREEVAEELEQYRNRQEFARSIFFPGKPVEHEKEPNEQDRNILGHLGASWKDGER
jgi:hypothetical protein